MGGAVGKLFSVQGIGVPLISNKATSQNILSNPEDKPIVRRPLNPKLNRLDLKLRYRMTSMHLTNKTIVSRSGTHQ